MYKHLLCVKEVKIYGTIRIWINNIVGDGSEEREKKQRLLGYCWLKGCVEHENNHSGWLGLRIVFIHTQLFLYICFM